MENEGHDAWGFARSKTVPRTPPQQNTCPAALSEAPAAPRRNQRRTMTPFDTEEEDPNGCEETSGALGPAGTLGTTRSPVQTLNAAMETLSSMRTSGQNVAIRDAVLSMLKEVIQQIEKPSEHARPGMHGPGPGPRPIGPGPGPTIFQLQDRPTGVSFEIGLDRPGPSRFGRSLDRDRGVEKISGPEPTDWIGIIQ